MNVKRILSLALSYLPSKLPVGLTEFHAYADEIIDLSGKFADEDSMKFAIASQLIHLPPTKSKCAKQYFIRSLRKAAANQVASQIFQDIKQKQAEAMAKQQAEATANKEAASNGTEKAQNG